MLLSFFEKYIFLQSLGWGIANSLWQAALLWMMYQLITGGNKNLSALFKYHLSLSLLGLSFTWFVITTFQNYLLLKNSTAGSAINGWLYVSGYFHTVLQWLSVAYLALLLLHSVQFVKRFAGLYFLRNRQLIKAPVDTRIFTEQTAFHLGIKKKVSIWLSENVEVPSVIGFFKPIILLPVAALSQLTTEQAEGIILHELAHIKRNDYLLNLLQSFIELSLFFNPFARLLGTAARKERENCCDDWVLNYRYNKHDYAAALLILEQQRTLPVTLALAATNGKKNLLGRIKRLFAAEPQTNMNWMQQVKLMTVSIVILLSMFFILPTISREASTEETTFTNQNILPILSSIIETANNPETAKTNKMINSQPIKTVLEKLINEKSKVALEQIKNTADTEVEYSIALVNEELLKLNKELQNISVQAADKEEPATPELFVKVEEEQSGIKEKNTYLLQLKNNNGTTEIKPLIILNKQMKKLSQKIKAETNYQRTDSLKSTVKKRITS